MGLPMAQNLSNEAAHGPDFVEAISLKPLDGFIPYEVIWSCLYLLLCNMIVISPSHWMFRVKFRKFCIPGVEGSNDVE